MSKEKVYNYIYEQLVEDEDDITGIIAYSVYKRQKIQHIKKFEKEKRRDLNDEELQSFTDFSTSNPQLEFYRNESVILITKFLETILAQDLEEREQTFTAKVHAEISNIKPNHFLDIIKGAAGSLLFVLLTGVLYIALWSFSVSPKTIIEEIFKVTIVSNESKPPIKVQEENQKKSL